MEIFTEKTIERFQNGIFVDREEFLVDDENNIMEAYETRTYLIKEKIYPKVEAVLNTPAGEKKFENFVASYLNRNMSKLMTIGPVYLIPFTVNDKNSLYEIFNVDEKEFDAGNGRVKNSGEITKLVDDITNQVNEKANWSLFKRNPVFILLYCVVRYYTIKQNSRQLNNALAITALAFYPSIFHKYFRYEVTRPEVMQYTIDNLSQRYIVKKSKTIFGTLTYSIQNSWKFHEKLFYDGSDQECIHFIQRIRNDQNSLIKKITTNYKANYSKGLAVTTQVDTFDNGIIVDNENNTNKVESVTNKIVTAMLVNGIDLKVSDCAADASSISKIELRNYLVRISTDKNAGDMKSFIESILFIYLYDEKHTFEEINSKQFLAYALSLFKKTNSKNSNINNIKNLLDKWGTDSGIYGKFSRLATRVDYTRGIFLYFILSIQKYA